MISYCILLCYHVYDELEIIINIARVARVNWHIVGITFVIQSLQSFFINGRLFTFLNVFKIIFECFM